MKKHVKSSVFPYVWTWLPELGIFHVESWIPHQKLLLVIRLFSVCIFAAGVSKTICVFGVDPATVGKYRN